MAQIFVLVMVVILAASMLKLSYDATKDLNKDAF